MAKLNSVYEDAVKNKVKGKPMIPMPLDEFIEEHEELIKVLREGTREELLAMAEEQEEELEECKKEHGIEDDTEEDD